jgi:hypothetical protein
MPEAMTISELIEQTRVCRTEDLERRRRECCEGGHFWAALDANPFGGSHLHNGAGEP